MSDELKPVRCGCGGEAKIDAYLGDLHRSNLYYIYCAKCDIRTSNYLSEAEAITAWNKAMGASAEPELKWIPVIEALPEMKEVVLITNDKGNVAYGKYQGTFRNNNEWFWRHKTLQTVIAWMPLPEPWRGEE